MPPKSKKPPIKPKSLQKAVKPVAKKTQGGTNPFHMVESFIRDISFESFLPPSLYPREKRDLDFHLAATVRPAGKNISCVNIALRVRISPLENPPFIIYEMIQEGVFQVSCENKNEAETLYKKGGPQVYAVARNQALAILAAHGVVPPIPEVIDFNKMWQESQNSK